jgi:hypothetical protein
MIVLAQNVGVSFREAAAEFCFRDASLPFRAAISVQGIPPPAEREIQHAACSKSAMKSGETHGDGLRIA